MTKIAKAGIYDLTMDEYHGDCCIAPSLSSSGARAVLDCPAKFYEHSFINPKKTEKPDTLALRMGKAAHDILYYGELPGEYYYILPEDFNGCTKEGKAEKSEAEERGLIVLKHKDAETIKQMTTIILDAPMAVNALTKGEKEKSLIWQDKDTGVWLKVRPDVVPDNLDWLPDYKTVRSAKVEDFSRDIYSYGYHIQAALYLRGVREVLGRKMKGFIFVAQEKKPPYVVSVLKLSQRDIEWGDIQLTKAIHVFAECLRTGVWQGYYNEPMECPIPAWAEIALSTADENGAFNVPRKEEENEPSNDTAKYLDAG